MKNKTIIFLSVLIALMLGIIVSAVFYLYSTPKAPEAALDREVAQAVEPQPAAEPQTEPESEQVQEPEKAPEPEITPEPEQVPEQKPAPKQPQQPAAKGPAEFQVKNSGTGKMNTLRQNADNSLALIDHNGKQLWKIAFPGKIVGEPAQIDIYNNLKIQYLIAEGSKLHLIDRLGREVKKFPLTLPGAAKSGPVDFKKDKLVYWQIETSAGTAYFDKQNVKILNQKP